MSIATEPRSVKIGGYKITFDSPGVVIWFEIIFLVLMGCVLFLVLSVPVKGFGWYVQQVGSLVAAAACFGLLLWLDNFRLRWCRDIKNEREAQQNEGARHEIPER